jgi:hypothetical protein
VWIAASRTYTVGLVQQVAARRHRVAKAKLLLSLRLRGRTAWQADSKPLAF